MYGLIKIPFGLEIQYHFTLLLNTPRDNYTVMSQLCQIIKYRKWINEKKSPSLTLTLSKQIKEKNIHNLYKRILFGSLIPWELQVATGWRYSLALYSIYTGNHCLCSSNILQQDQLSRKCNYLANPLSYIKGLQAFIKLYGEISYYFLLRWLW